MKTILIEEKELDIYLKEAKEAVESEGEVEIKGYGRETVRAVDVAELLKLENFQTVKIEISTEEKEEKRMSLIIIHVKR